MSTFVRDAMRMLDSWNSCALPGHVGNLDGGSLECCCSVTPCLFTSQQIAACKIWFFVCLLLCTCSHAVCTVARGALHTLGIRVMYEDITSVERRAQHQGIQKVASHLQEYTRGKSPARCRRSIQAAGQKTTFSGTNVIMVVDRS